MTNQVHDPTAFDPVDDSPPPNHSRPWYVKWQAILAALAAFVFIVVTLLNLWPGASKPRIRVLDEYCVAPGNGGVEVSVLGRRLVCSADGCVEGEPLWIKQPFDIFVWGTLVHSGAVREGETVVTIPRAKLNGKSQPVANP